MEDRKKEETGKNGRLEGKEQEDRNVGCVMMGRQEDRRVGIYLSSTLPIFHPSMHSSSLPPF